MKYINLEQHPSDVAAEILDYVNQKLASRDISLRLVKKLNGWYLDMEEQLQLDLDLDDEPLGKPASCNLGEACESCQ